LRCINETRERATIPFVERKVTRRRREMTESNTDVGYVLLLYHSEVLRQGDERIALIARIMEMQTERKNIWHCKESAPATLNSHPMAHSL
jgi:hypothetical protein